LASDPDSLVTLTGCSAADLAATVVTDRAGMCDRTFRAKPAAGGVAAAYRQLPEVAAGQVGRDECL